jgi:hypothetical protein
MEVRMKIMRKFFKGNGIKMWRRKISKILALALVVGATISVQIAPYAAPDPDPDTTTSGTAVGRGLAEGKSGLQPMTPMLRLRYGVNAPEPQSDTGIRSSYPTMVDGLREASSWIEPIQNWDSGVYAPTLISDAAALPIAEHGKRGIPFDIVGPDDLRKFLLENPNSYPNPEVSVTEYDRWDIDIPLTENDYIFQLLDPEWEKYKGPGATIVPLRWDSIEPSRAGWDPTVLALYS